MKPPKIIRGLLVVTIGGLLVSGYFQGRVRRFLCRVNVNGSTKIAFLPHTGRLQDILVRGARVTLRKVPHRTKVEYDILAVYQGDTPIIVDSRLPNVIVAEAIAEGRLPEFAGYRSIKKEVRVGTSRLDFMLEDEKPCYLEVKGCTLAINSIALYPDAPTLRGAEHLRLLTALRKRQQRAAVFFLAMRPDVRSFKVNEELDPEFARELSRAKSAGVEVYAYSSVLEGDTARIGHRLIC